jgi:hypothetical protein
MKSPMGAGEKLKWAGAVLGKVRASLQLRGHASAASLFHLARPAAAPQQLLRSAADSFLDSPAPGLAEARDHHERQDVGQGLNAHR